MLIPLKEALGSTSYAILSPKIPTTPPIMMHFPTKYPISSDVPAINILAPVSNPTLQVIGLQIPCMEKAGVAVDASHLYLG